MSCSARSALAGTDRVPVTVNGVAIPHDLIAREAQNHPAPSPVAAWTAAARALVVRELLLVEARRLGIAELPVADAAGRIETAEEAQIRALLEQEVKVPEADEASCRRYYERNLRHFRSADIYEAAHILIAARRDEPEAFAAAREQTTALLTELGKDASLFAALARTHSTCPSAESGGNLGQITSGDTTPEFEKALLSLDPGETTRTPVETRYGFHIIRLDRRIAGVPLPFEIARERIADYLAERAQRLALAQYVAVLVSRADVSGIDLPTAADLRVH